MSKYEKVANWIMSECDSPISEIEWLLEQIYNPKESRVEIDFDKVICPKIEDDYDAVFKQIKENEK